MTQRLRVTEIAQRTNLSRRYWQRCFARGGVPGTRQVQFGRRRHYFAERPLFEPWWADLWSGVDIIRNVTIEVTSAALDWQSAPLTARSGARIQWQRRAKNKFELRQCHFHIQESGLDTQDVDDYDP